MEVYQNGIGLEGVIAKCLDIIKLKGSANSNSSSGSGLNISSSNNNNNNNNRPFTMQQCGDSPQPPQQFCLRWNNYQSNLTNVFDQLLQSESFVDVTLACDGHSIKAHKMVLSACSPYFRQLFFENPCQHPIIILKDINWPELKATVEFMYKGEINVSQDQIGPLLKVAENLKIRGLADVNGEDQVEAKSQPSKKIGSGWDPKTSTLHNDENLDEDRPSSPMTLHANKKRRRKCSPERSSIGRNSVLSRDSISSPEISPGAPDSLEAVAIDMSPPPQPPIGINLSNHVNSHTHNQHSPARPQSRGQPHSAPPHLAAEPPSLPLPLPPTVPPPLPVDDMEIKPGIAEMIREEERVSDLFLLSFILILSGDGSYEEFKKKDGKCSIEFFV